MNNNLYIGGYWGTWRAQAPQKVIKLYQTVEASKNMDKTNMLSPIPTNMTNYPLMNVYHLLILCKNML